MSLVKAISLLCASCSATVAKRKYLSWILPIAAAIILSASPASAQTPFSFSFTGNGTSSGGNFSMAGSGTITPYGATTISVNGTQAGGGSLGIGFVVTFGDGSTWNATSTVTPTSSTSISGTATINSGTGTFLGAHGTFSYVASGSFTTGSFAFTVTGAGTLSISTGTRVVPGAWGNNTGTNTSVAGISNSNRYQELIGPQQLGSGTIIINQIAFRAYAGTGPLTFTIANLTVNLSTSPLFPNIDNGRPLMSTTFANNIGPDNTLVFSGPKNVTSPGCAGPSPCPFDVVIPLSTPFVSIILLSEAYWLTCSPPVLPRRQALSTTRYSPILPAVALRLLPVRWATLPEPYTRSGMSYRLATRDAPTVSTHPAKPFPSSGGTAQTLPSTHRWDAPEAFRACLTGSRPAPSRVAAAPRSAFRSEPMAGRIKAPRSPSPACLLPSSNKRNRWQT